MARPDCAISAPEFTELVERLAQARAQGSALRLSGGDTKHAFWHTTATVPLSLRDYRGIIAYEPSELVVTARAGTRLDELESALAARGQMLGFEPPRTGAESTIGGVVAAALSGPARPFRGGVRDFMLGATLLTGTGEILRFGGQVMKNVAGYDVSRLLAGSWGCLGPIVEISLRVVPIPARSVTVRWHCDEQDAWRRMRELGHTTHPVTGCRYEGGVLSVRLAGAAPAVTAAIRALSPANLDEAGASEWRAWTDFAHPFFAPDRGLWRAVVPAATPPLPIAGECAWDWGGALRWYRLAGAPDVLVRAVAGAGGFCSPWPSKGLEFPLDSPAHALAERVRAAFDPERRFNPVSAPDQSVR